MMTGSMCKGYIIRGNHSILCVSLLLTIHHKCLSFPLFIYCTVREITLQVIWHKMSDVLESEGRNTERLCLRKERKAFEFCVHSYNGKLTPNSLTFSQVSGSVCHQQSRKSNFCSITNISREKCPLLQKRYCVVVMLREFVGRFCLEGLWRTHFKFCWELLIKSMTVRYGCLITYVDG